MKFIRYYISTHTNLLVSIVAFCGGKKLKEGSSTVRSHNVPWDLIVLNMFSPRTGYHLASNQSHSG